MSLSNEQALNFLENTLGMKDFKAKFSSNKLETLQEITLNLSEKVPFHNVTLLSQSDKAEQRKTNDLHENIKALLSCSGGLCWELNSSVYALLKALGYQTYMVLGNYVQFDADKRGDHAVVIVTDVCKSGDTYLVDVALGGSPCFEPVCLDMEEGGESKIMAQATQTFKYVKRDGKYVRMAKDHRKYAITEGEWGAQCTFELTPCPLDEMRKSIEINAHGNPVAIINKIPIIVVWINNKRVLIMGNGLKIEGPGKEICEQREVNNEEEILAVCKQYFPSIDKDQILKAYHNIDLQNQRGGENISSEKIKNFQ